MHRQNYNAMEIAQWLENHPAIEQVLYPGLPSHPQHALAKAQMKSFGGIVSMVLKENTLSASKSVLEALKHIPLRMISYGGSDHNLSILLNTNDKIEALRSLHNRLF